MEIHQKETDRIKASRTENFFGTVPLGLSCFAKRDWLWALILVLGVIAVYQPVWYAGFIWDDHIIVTANPVIIGPLGLKEIWTVRAAQFYPLTLTTFWGEYALWGLAPLPYHLMNVLQHGAGAVLLWRILRSLQVPGAWLGAALWALHPVQVESVAWISEMKNTQSALFFLLSIFFFVKSQGTADRAGAGWNYGWTLFFAAMAMASKSSTVMLPVVLCLCAWWMKGRWEWRNLKTTAPVFLMSIITTVVSITAFQLDGVRDPLSMRSWPERCIDAGYAVWFYLGKLFWPHPLIVVYPRWEVDYGYWTSYLPLVAVGLLLLVLYVQRESWVRPFFFAFTYFFIVIFPVLGLVSQSFMRSDIVSDHLQYLADMAPLALIGAGLTRLAGWVAPGARWMATAFLAGLLLILGATSWQRTWAYENEETLWTDTLVKNPKGWLGYSNLGSAFFQKGKVDEATVLFQKALEIYPDDPQTLNNLGNAFLYKGHLDEAQAQFQKVLGMYPGNVEAHNNLGGVYLGKARVNEAVGEFQKALKIDPNDADAYNNLGNVLFQKGQMDDASVYYQKALAINPHLAKAEANLGAILLQKGQLDEAMVRFQKALAIEPNYAAAHYSLGGILARKGEMDEAMAQFRKVLEIDPNNAEAHNNLGVIFYRRGQLDEAIIQFKEAVRLKPDYFSAESHLVHAQAEKGYVRPETLRSNPTAAP